MINQFFNENKDIFGLRWLFRNFDMAPNAYYNYLKDNKAAYRKQKQKIYEEIKNIYYNNNRILGHRGMEIFLARKAWDFNSIFMLRGQLFYKQCFATEL